MVSARRVQAVRWSLINQADIKRGEMKNDKLLEVSVVAKRLGVCDMTVYRMIHSDDNPLVGVRLHRKCIRVLESTVKAAIEQSIIGDA